MDASVILKWLLADPVREPDTRLASALMESIADGRHEIIQPPHWLAEVAAVLARLSPATAEDDVAMLRAMEWPVCDEVTVWARACRRAIDTRQHLFDTLYHATALESASATLVTADKRYMSAAGATGRIMPLRDWVL